MEKSESGNERFLRYKKILLKIIYEELPDCKVYLFGSRARNDYRSGSDIDIALDIGTPINSKKLYIIKEKIEETIIPLNVDLVDLSTTKDEFRNEIEKEGILWEN